MIVYGGLSTSGLLPLVANITTKSTEDAILISMNRKVI